MSDSPIEEEIVWEIWEQIPDNLILWPHGDELAEDHFTDRTYEWWRHALKHPRGVVPRMSCTQCGDICLLAVFHEAVAISVIRELMRQGLIVGDFRDRPAPDAGPSDVPDL